MRRAGIEAAMLADHADTDKPYVGTTGIYMRSARHSMRR